MKGCDQQKRSKFHLNLRQLFAHENLSCQLMFPRIDSSLRDELIDRSEWKSFKKQWRSKIGSKLRKCFRTEVEYCDQNGDWLISRDEWLKCCNNTDNNDAGNNNNDEDIIDNNNQQQSKSARPPRNRSQLQQRDHNNRQLHNSHKITTMFTGGGSSSQIMDAYNAKKNLPRKGKNPLNILI